MLNLMCLISLHFVLGTLKNPENFPPVHLTVSFEWFSKVNTITSFGLWAKDLISTPC